MNLWVSDEFKQPGKPMDRGKVLSAEDLERLGGNFARYRDVDGDGIPYRTLPGTPHANAAYFTRGTGHSDKATYCETPEVWAGNLDRLNLKFETARKELPAPVIEKVAGAEIGIIAYGSSDPAAREAVSLLGKQQGTACSYLRLRALPVHQDAYEFIARHKRVYVVDQNRDAQMASIMRAEQPLLAAKMLSVRHYDGTTLDAQTIIDQILRQEAAQQEGME